MNLFRPSEMLKLSASVVRFTSRSGGERLLQRVVHSRTIECFSIASSRSFCRQAPGFEEPTQEPVRLQISAALSTWSEETSKKEVMETFFSELQECRSPSDVLDLAERCGLAHWCISSSLTRMWQTTRRMSDEQRRCEFRLMAEHPSFERLCHRARISAPNMSSHDLVFTLLGLVKLGVPHSSLVVQTFLRVIQELLNQLEDEKSLSILASCLIEMESSRNAEALKDGLKLVLEERLASIQSVTLLHSTMRLFGKDAPQAMKKKLEMKALAMSADFTLPNAQFMLDTLAAMRLNSKPLLDICCTKLAENVHSVPFIRLLSLLKSCRELRYRNLALFTAVSDYLAGTLSMWSNKQVILFLLQFKGLKFGPVALMDAFAERIIQKPESLTLRGLLAILKCYSYLNHPLKDQQGEFLKTVTHVLESYLPKISSLDLLKAVSCLCVFNHLPPAPLEKLLQQQTLDELLQNEGSWYKQVQWMLTTLDLCLRIDRPSLPPSVSPIPPLQRSLPPPHLPVHPGLVGTLRSLFGEQAVSESVIQEGGYYIDCVITFPHDAEQGGEEQSGTSQPPCRVAVLCVPPSSYCFGTTHPCGALGLKIRHLKILDYNPVLVPLQEFHSHTEQERVDILKRLVHPAMQSSVH